MSGVGNLALGGGVFGAVFLCAWFLLPHAGKGPPPSAPKLATPEPAGAAQEVLPTFSQVRTAQAKNGLSEPRPEVQAEGEREMARRILAFKGQKVSEAMLIAAQNDAPPSDKYVRFAKIEQGAETTLCTSSRSEKEVEHRVTVFTKTEVRPDLAGMSLPQYVLSGCAQAIQEHSRLISHVQYLQAFSGLLPKTTKYDQDRQELAEAIRTASRTR